MNSHAAELATLRRQLLSGPVPRWELQIERLLSAPVPNLGGNIDLQKLLLADALAHVAVGDHEGALERLESSWRLNAALREDPMLITQLVSMAVTRMQVGVLRQLGDAPVIWPSRLNDVGYRDTFLVALQLESRFWIEFDSQGGLWAAPNVLQRIAWKVTGPYFRFCMASVSDQMRKRMAALAAAQALCDGDPEYH